MASDYTLEQLQQAFIAADDAGDAESAQAFAAEIAKRNMPQMTAAPEQASAQTDKGFWQSFKDEVWNKEFTDEERQVWNRIINDPPKSPAGDEFSLLNTARNIPYSWTQTGRGVQEMITNPVDTAATMGKTLLGTGQLLYPGEQEYEAYPKALADYYGGVLENPGKAIEENPVGLGLDIYTLGRTGGGLLKNVARAGSKMLPETLPARLYQRGAKFSTTLSQEELAKITNTALKEGLLYTDKGMKRLNAKMADFDQKINSIIDKATASGQMIDRSVVNKTIPALIKAVGGFKRYAKKDIAYIKQEMGNLDDWMGGRKKVSPRDLQDFKQDLYQRLFRDYAKQQPVTAIREKLDKTLARGAREGLETAIPDQSLADLNRQWGDLLDLKENLAKSAVRVGNRDPFSLTDIATVTGGSAMAGPVGGAIGGVIAAARHPVPMGRAGIGLYNLQNPTTGLLRLQPRDALLGLLQTGHIQDLIDQQGQ